MRIHNNLPSYYNGLTSETVRNGYPAAMFPNSRQINKIPTLIEPTETADRYSLALNVSGVHLNDIAVVITDDQLLIEVEKEFDPFKVAHTNWDKCFGVFRRAFELPKDSDKKQINYLTRDGGLFIEILKLDSAQKSQTKKTPILTPPQAEL